VSAEYDEVRDIQKFDGQGDFLTIRSGTFVLFGPKDAHASGILLDKPQKVKKAVIKVSLENNSSLY